MHTIVEVENLSTEERELVRAAMLNQGVLEIASRAETHGRAIVAGRKKFFDARDRGVAEKYIALLANLKQMELIHEAANKNAYELTNFGWQLGRKLRRA